VLTRLGGAASEHGTGTAVPPQSHSISATLHGVILSCLEKDPARQVD